MHNQTDHYDYDLPTELVAQQPLPCRSDARLMLVDRAAGSIEHYHVRDLPEMLQAGDRLVLNNTRVVPAQLAGRRSLTGGKWRGLFLQADEGGLWHILSKTRGRLQPGETVILQGHRPKDDRPLRLVQKLPDGAWIAKPEGDGSTMEILQQVGRVPLPPYIRGGEMTDRDRITYQTVFAEKDGSVAAPTAGLHFTQSLLEELKRRGIGASRVTLHVGVGTFRPISADDIEQHQMHAEWAELDGATAAKIEETRRAGGSVVAVGTTAVRTLETAAAEGPVAPFSGKTSLYIRPPYEFRCVDALLTNFHLPRTTLLVLARTFGGDDLIRRAYQQAIDQRYRFFSYGDAMLIV